MTARGVSGMVDGCTCVLMGRPSSGPTGRRPGQPTGTAHCRPSDVTRLGAMSRVRLDHSSDVPPAAARNAPGRRRPTREERDLIELESDPSGTLVTSSAVTVRAGRPARADGRSGARAIAWLTRRETAVAGTAIGA